MKEITDPTLILNEEKCKQNIEFMVEKARKHGLKLRPHFKTHQSHEIGRWFRDKGVSAITVSSVNMAQYFAEDGWEEITIAFPVNIRKIDTLNELASKVKLNVLVSSKETPMLLTTRLKHAVNVYIEIDCGSNRSGFRFDDIETIQKTKMSIVESELLNFIGYYSHAGHTYNARSTDQIKTIATKALSDFTSIKKIDNDVEFCWGDTPSCSVLDNFENIQAISPGNFVFYDVMQNAIGSCDLNKVAVAVCCPIVAKKDDVLEVCIHGGAIHFSKDSIVQDGQAIFGVPVTNDTWEPLTGAYVRAVSQEHGIVKLTAQDYDKYQVGDVMYILPIHSCLTAESIGGYLTEAGSGLGHMSKKSRD